MGKLNEYLEMAKTFKMSPQFEESWSMTQAVEALRDIILDKFPNDDEEFVLNELVKRYKARHLR